MTTVITKIVTAKNKYVKNNEHCFQHLRITQVSPIQALYPQG